MTEISVPKSSDLGEEARSFYQDLKRHLALTLGHDRFSVTSSQIYMALALAVRDRLTEARIATQQQYYLTDAKRVYYLSMEFLIGRTLGNAILNLNLEEPVRQALAVLGHELEELGEFEPDAGLGNGGLGRLAACFLDSLATLEYPAFGYGLRYEFGIFHQQIKDGFQIEEPDNWLKSGNPWELPQPEAAQTVGFGGTVETHVDPVTKRLCFDWIPSEQVVAMPYDTPVPGYNNHTVNTLRLWSAKASTNEFDLSLFNEGAYVDAIEQRALAENITKILYPNDAVAQGRELRLKQQYFMTAATLKDILRRHFKHNKCFSKFAERHAIQLNDTHPAIAIPEFMRLLVDEYLLGWSEAWTITQGVFAYTNHTLLEEALEKWSVELIERLLPRHMQIIHEINRRFLRQVANKFPGDMERLRRMSLVTDSEHPQVRMAYLAIAGSHSVNGVAKLHTELLRTRLVSDFNEMYPEKFNSKTNGIAHRRWIMHCNRGLTNLIDDSIGTDWKNDLCQLEGLRKFADDSAFLERFAEIKLNNKKVLAKLIKDQLNIAVDPNSMFDVQIKRIHEYKRQLLNALNVVAMYLQLKTNPTMDFAPRTVIISGKAAPGYFMAKLIIKLINSIAEVVNSDPLTRDRLKLVFLPNYSVSLAEKIIPAADLSEQISTAGKEASGTGNMKLALNGALTIGTLDGANIEMLQEIGDEHMFIFGLTVEQITEMRKQGYNPLNYCDKGTLIRHVIELIESGHFSLEKRDQFEPILHSLLYAGDQYMLMADFEAYSATQKKVGEVYMDQNRWRYHAVHNVAGIGYFSSDRTIREYATEIWKLTPTHVPSRFIDWEDELRTRTIEFLRERDN